MPVHLQVKNPPYDKSAQISVRDALFTTAPYRLHRSVRKHTERQNMPPSGAAASRFGKSPDGAVHSTCGEIFTDFTSIDFGAAKLSRLCTARYGIDGLCTLVYASVRRLCVPAADLAAGFTLYREMLHGVHK